MQITIHRMERQDVPAVSALEAKIFSVPWSIQGFYDTIEMDNVIFLVAMEETTLCGYCGIYLAADEGEITNVAVAPTYRRSGIGERLVRQLLIEGGKMRIRNYILEVRASNEGAIKLYTKLGFSVGGTRRNFYERPREDALVMMMRQ